MTFLEPVRARFHGLVADMSPRDRNLFLGLVVMAYIAILGAAGWGGKGLLADLQSRISTRETALTRLQELETQYVANEGKVKEIEDILRKNGKEELPSYVEKAAQKYGLSPNLKAVREKGSNTEGNLVEKTYTVELDKLALSQLTDFLFEVETNNYPMRIRTGRIKATGAPGTRLLGVTFEVSAFSLDESGEASAPADGGTK